MYGLEIELGRAYISEHYGNSAIRLCSLTGSHSYGFPSKDSDLDLKGIHIAPASEFLGLGKPRETISKIETIDNVEYDLTSHEVAKALRLLFSGNGNMLERILSPYALFENDITRELRHIATGALSKRFASHYLGFCRGQWKQLQAEEMPRIKTMLYVYRTALTGIHLLTTGQVDVNLESNAKRYGFDTAQALMRQKVNHTEKTVLVNGVEPAHQDEFERLTDTLVASKRLSSLPDEPTNEEHADKWLVNLRLSN